MSKKGKLGIGEWIMIVAAVIATIIFAIGVLYSILK